MATYVETLRTLLSEEIGDVIFGTNTSATTSDGNAGATTLVDSTLMAMPSDWVRTGTGGEMQTAIKLTSGTYDLQIRYAEEFDNTTGTITVSSAFGGKVVSGVTYEIHRIAHPTMKDECIERAAKDAYPFLYDEVDSTAFTFGDILEDGSFEEWPTSATLSHWTASGVTLARTGTVAYTHDSAYACALSTATGYVGQSVANINDLQMCGGTHPTFYAWVKASTASQVRLAIYDGTTTTYSDYHSGGGAWELLDVSAAIADSPTDVAFRVYYADTATTAYVDECTVVGAYHKYDYDISSLGLVNDLPDAIYTVEDRDSGYSSPKPHGLSTLITEWKQAPDHKIRFLYDVGSGTRLRIMGRKYLSAGSSTSATVAAGASFLDLTDTDDTSYTGKAGYVVTVNTGATGLVFSASAASQHPVGSSTAHSADTWADFQALISDATPCSEATADSKDTAAVAAHVAAADPHTGYRLESADHTHATTGAQGGQIDHGTGHTAASLLDDDHTQYITKALMTTAGDIIYASGASTPTRLAAGTDGHVLTAGGAGIAPAWEANASDITGSNQVFIASSTSNAAAKAWATTTYTCDLTADQAQVNVATAAFHA